ncbi:class I SAM-dependent methyltransferase [Rhodoferax sp.]|uniref:class I SAM-dependent methyltransferase n=1 Tax=Rhodoferax sp. TaxID=50421 RepID=UPI00275FC792|nr:class I SAM-dependent methyltransferase [Rhodoferax sp.]
MSQDTGTQLHSLYEPIGGVDQIFGAKVADYRASRPDYPVPLFELLRSQCGLSAATTVADVGAGTGLLTRGLLQTGARVIAVEPNAAMRGACDHALQATPNYLSVEGCAEAMPLEAGSVDLITAAQAFHWFEIERARSECLRVLRPAGQVALVWNDRLFSDPLHVALDGVFAEFGGEKRAALLAHEDRALVPRFFGAGRFQTFHWPHEHVLSQDGLLCLVFSRSYMPERKSEPGQRAADRVREISQALATGKQIVVRYTTVLMLGRPQGEPVGKG